MINQRLQVSMTAFLVASSLMGCQSPAPPPQTDGDSTGSLSLQANGEDFVRQGFTSKEGWQIEFNHVYVSLGQVRAYQTDPPFNAEVDEEMQAKTTLDLSSPQTVDLAAGEADAEPILVAQLEDVPAGVYNALSWQMVPAVEGPAEGHTLLMDGVAKKGEQTINFKVSVDREYAYSCGEFVGDQRKGIVTGDEPGNLEATFHLDHIFGDGSAPAEDEINVGALGFDPLAKLAKNGTVEVDESMWRSQLSPEEVKRFDTALNSLGHVGEGHCHQSSPMAAQP
ncbi:DUF4382 domain-containing protein [Roseofilum sp. BLCC_M154]|uniref:DUF4382 domain-containing protein n=1 Tax=Roseofilum acuticapitatum BLCC-M154 TaxID=3022444 RepID=A0ABT7AUN8_9CYAN|nr:hypothetical protein [Roseofilum acuticapitatum]MDJ1170606.1 DUF4382 domain-containing protein [Roseofilum acuticapitatum BLCC-M154]